MWLEKTWCEFFCELWVFLSTMAPRNGPNGQFHLAGPWTHRVKSKPKPPSSTGGETFVLATQRWATVGLQWIPFWSFLIIHDHFWSVMIILTGYSHVEFRSFSHASEICRGMVQIPLLRSSMQASLWYLWSAFCWQKTLEISQHGLARSRS